MDQIKDAFKNVKEDIGFLNTTIQEIKEELNEIQFSILNLTKLLNSDRQTDTKLDNKTHTSTHNNLTSTQNNQNKTQNSSELDTSTHNYHSKSLKRLNIDVSIGNEGVSTDRQTDNQTDTSTHFPQEIGGSNAYISPKNTTFSPKNNKNKENNVLDSENTSIVLEQLDSLKKDIRLKIKRLTKQEMLIFSSIYQFENQGELVDYSFLSINLNLSESSIRDYVQRIITKGLPIIKEKINNKKIILHISEDLKKLASLNTLLELRNL